MLITKCDICKKEIRNRDKKVTAGLGWDTNEMCLDCGKLIINFLLKNKPVTKAEIEKLRK